MTIAYVALKRSGMVKRMDSNTFDAFLMANLFLGRWLSRRIRERHEDGKIGFGQGVNAHVSYFLGAFVAMKKSFAHARCKNSVKTRRLKS